MRAVADALARVVCPDTVSLVADVVARVDVPTIVRVPLARRLPPASAKKLRFSVHADPFQ